MFRKTISLAAFAGIALVLQANSLPAVEATLPTATAAKKPLRQATKQTAQEVDNLLAAELADNDSTKQIQYGKPANDETFLRRATLDLLGRNPTPDEVTAFILDPAANKRLKLVDRLLADPRFGDNWGRYWRDVILYRRSDDRALLTQQALFDYLRQAFNDNRPWDEIAREFITATGDVREKGQTALIMAQQGETSDITAEVSRIFLGIQIQCAQCHDHKTDRWKRTDFHELAAFFPRLAVRPVRDGNVQRSFEVVSVDRQPILRGQNNLPRGNTDHYMPDLENPSARGTKMEPIFFVSGQKLTGGPTDAERRGTAAKWITSPENEWFAKAFVNRLWAELVGEGFYEPIDDIGPDRTATAPKTLDHLAAAFVASGYDVKSLYRTIAATEAYGRESRSRRNANASPFTCNCPQRLRGDHLYDALVAALGLRERDFGGGGRYPGLRSERNQFNQIFGYDPSQPREEVVGSIPQALLLMNGSQINAAIAGQSSSTELGKLLSSTANNEAATVELYLRCFGREPNNAELATCLLHVKKAGTRAEAFEDILWSLVNSTEFLHRK